MCDKDIIEYFKEYRKNHKRLLERLIDEPILNYMKNRFEDSQSIKETLYRIEHNIENVPLCPSCGNPIKFDKAYNKFLTYCSKRCIMQDTKTKEKIKNTCQTKYGCDNPSQAKSVQEKRKQTNIERFGCENAFQNEEIKEKIKITNQTKYGVEHPAQNDEIKNKMKQTNLERYGCENAFQNKEIQEKQKKTNLEKYGYENAAKNEKVKEKAKQTNLNRYGVVSTALVPEIKAKQKQTTKSRFGVEYALQNKELFDKQKQTTKSRFGVEYAMQNPTVVEKSNETKRLRHTFNTSKPEDDCYKLLCEKFGSDDVRRQYSSVDYPFACDFYIQSKDLYIECNFHWTHGGHPFNPLNESDQKQLSEWREKQTDYYDNAAEVWFAKDPIKQQIAEERQLNYQCFYTTEDFDDWFCSL